MAATDADAEREVIGRYYAYHPRWRWLFPALAVANAAFGLAAGAWTAVPGVVGLLLLTSMAFVPQTSVDRIGVTMNLRRRLLWSEVQSVEEPTRWRPCIRLHLRDGQEVDLPHLTAVHLQGVRSLAGVKQ